MTKGMKLRMATPTRTSPSKRPLLSGGSPTQLSSFPKPGPASPCPPPPPHGSPHSGLLTPSLLPPVVDGTLAA